MANASVQLGNKSQEWFDNHADLQLEDGQHVYLNDNSGLYKKGDEAGTELQDLPWIGAGAVPSVNGQTGDVVLDAGDVGADPAGSAAAAETAAKTYSDALVVGLWDDRGNYNASVNTFPASGGSGSAGAIKKGDIWSVSVAGTLGGHVVTAGDTVRALIDTPGQTDANWAIAENNIGYVAENSANKDTDGTLAANSDTKYPSQKAAKTYIDTVAATKTDKQSQLLTGGAITIGDYDAGGSSNDIRVAASTYYVVGFGNVAGLAQDFDNIVLCATGNLRYIGIYGKIDGTLQKVEGAEGPYAVYPAQPANTAVFGYVLVNDNGINATKMDSNITFNDQVDDYTLVLSDNNKQVNMNKATAVVLTVPPNSSVAFPVGAQILGEQDGAGQVTITPGSGVTINCYNARNKTTGQYAGFTLVKKATDTWWLEGNLIT